MKYLKLLALVTVTWTVAEVVTQWRAYPEPISLVNFLKIYISESITEVANVVESIDYDSGPADAMKSAANPLMFPNREQ